MVLLEMSKLSVFIKRVVFLYKGICKVCRKYVWNIRVLMFEMLSFFKRILID